MDRHPDLCSHPSSPPHPKPEQGLRARERPMGSWSWRHLAIPVFFPLLEVSRVPGQAECAPIGLPKAREDQKLGQWDDLPRHTSPQGQRGEASGASG